MQCPRCQHDAPSDAEFCPECGTKLAAVCAQCGTTNVSGHKFCKKCGQPLTFAAGARPEGGRFGSAENPRTRERVPAARRRGQSRAPPRADCGSGRSASDRGRGSAFPRGRYTSRAARDAPGSRPLPLRPRQALLPDGRPGKGREASDDRDHDVPRVERREAGG